MPPKIRELISQLQSVGFETKGGKGGHRNFTHQKGSKITVSGKTGDDAKPYQIKAVKKAVSEVSQ
jgi:predicted RNA binding protein YcfA (HicA-like mRNA interferase family)